MRDPAYAAFSALDPFFDIVRQGLAGLVDGDHYFDTIAPDAVFEFRYRFPGWPTKLVGREALMALYAGYGEGMALHGADALVVNISQTPGVVILEYEVQGNAVGSGKLYENRFISVVLGMALSDSADPDAKELYEKLIHHPALWDLVPR